jgi:D-sedoheptulose 7-phosphate isomerase
MVDVCDHCFVVKTWSVHRVQETHTALLHLLWDEVHVALGEDDVL